MYQSLSGIVDVRVNHNLVPTNGFFVIEDTIEYLLLGKSQERRLALLQTESGGILSSGFNIGTDVQNGNVYMVLLQGMATCGSTELQAPMLYAIGPNQTPELMLEGGSLAVVGYTGTAGIPQEGSPVTQVLPFLEIDLAQHTRDRLSATDEGLIFETRNQRCQVQVWQPSSKQTEQKQRMGGNGALRLVLDGEFHSPAGGYPQGSFSIFGARDWAAWSSKNGAIALSILLE